MIYFDVTKTGGAGHRSGLTRVSGRLLEELSADATAVRWPQAAELVGRDGDWFLSGEIFSPDERPGFAPWLERHPMRVAAIFHDAIPLKLPHITWPQSVARHPAYLKMLSRFDRVWAVSETSRQELLDFWRWQGVEKNPPVDVLSLGADFDAAPRAQVSEEKGPERTPALLCVGIIEPRKNQSFLLDVAEDLWCEGLTFDLHLVGRVNPHFGAPIVKRIQSLRRTFPGLHFHAAADDATVARLYATARATVFPTIAEGCGLPLLESLWRGVPCICSDLPVLRENTAGGGCVAMMPNDRTAWKAAIRRMVTDDASRAQLAAAATIRPLPTWREAARTLVAALVAR